MSEYTYIYMATTQYIEGTGMRIIHFSDSGHDTHIIDKIAYTNIRTIPKNKKQDVYKALDKYRCAYAGKGYDPKDFIITQCSFHFIISLIKLIIKPSHKTPNNHKLNWHDLLDEYGNKFNHIVSANLNKIFQQDYVEHIKNTITEFDKTKICCDMISAYIQNTIASTRGVSMPYDIDKLFNERIDKLLKKLIGAYFYCEPSEITQ